MLRPFIRTCLVVILLILAAERSFAAGTERWTEVRSPNFLLLSEGSETQGRRVALQFELIRAVFRQFFNIPGAAKEPRITIIAVKNEDGLKRLMPEGGSSPPGSAFVDSWEKKYIALRLDRLEIEATAEGFGQRTVDPYANIHRGYIHFLADRLPTELPLWMMEGLTEFFGSVKVEYRQIVFGAPSGTNIEVLHATKMLPLATLFAVDASSPYYHEENRRSIFYAQSWLLMKYMVTRDWREGTHRVTDFVGLLEQMEPQEAARRTIGDPVSLQKELQRYLHLHLYSTAGLPMPPSLDAHAFTSEPASPAELAAVRAAFMALGGQSAEEHKMLEEDLQLAMSLLLPTQRHEVTVARAESSLRAAIKTKPDFAPAYEALANLLARRPETQEEAYRMALQAVNLDAGNVHYRLNLSWVLEMMGRLDEAVRVAELAASMAETPDERRDVATRLAMARQQQEDQKKMEESEPEVSDRPDQPERPELEPNPTMAEGLIEKAECNSGTTIDVTVKTGSGEIHLYSDRYQELLYTALNFTLKGTLNPCRDLTGWHARISYRPAKDPANPGEMMAVVLVLVKD